MIIGYSSDIEVSGRRNLRDHWWTRRHTQNCQIAAVLEVVQEGEDSTCHLAGEYRSSCSAGYFQFDFVWIRIRVASVRDSMHFYWEKKAPALVRNYRCYF